MGKEQGHRSQARPMHVQPATNAAMALFLARNLAQSGDGAVTKDTTSGPPGERRLPSHRYSDEELEQLSPADLETVKTADKLQLEVYRLIDSLRPAEPGSCDGTEGEGDSVAQIPPSSVSPAPGGTA